jgi:dethiobiotin synthetase
MATGGFPIALRKPVQSFDPHDGPTDADVLAAASGAEPTAVCPAHRWYEVPLAPPMAAEALGRPAIPMRALVEETNAPPHTTTLVEGAGGARSPLADDGDTVALAISLDARGVVLVTPAGLGAINGVRLGVDAFAPLRVVVFLNRFDPENDTHSRNLMWLREKDGFEVFTSIRELAGAWHEASARTEVG